MNPRNAQTPTERIHALEAALSESLSTLSILQVERDVLRSLLLPDAQEPKTLTLRERSLWFDPVGAHRPQQPLVHIGDILEKRDRK
jgi:hypothetical protein